MSNTKKADSFLLRFRAKDSITGVSSETFERLMEATGLGKTELVHFALAEMVDRFIPSYERDDGPLTEAQLRIMIESAQIEQEPDESFEML